MRQLIEAGTW